MSDQARKKERKKKRKNTAESEGDDEKQEKTFSLVNEKGIKRQYN